MACYGCTTKFSFFNKQNACPSCGFGYCSKCLTFKCVVPNRDTEQKVCKSCWNKITSGNKTNDEIIPPDAFIRRLENLENPSRPPITVYRDNKRMQELRTGLSRKDQEIADRLEKLRADRKLARPPTDEEIRQRLCQLRGEPYYNNVPTQASRMALQSDTRSDEEKVSSLIEQFTSEFLTDTSTTSYDLETNRPGTSSDQSSYDSDIEPEDPTELLNKIMEEVRMEKNRALRHPHSLQLADRGTPLHASTPELGYCRICLAPAIKRCIDCEGDLYCADCFAEIHRDWSEMHHKYTDYVQVLPMKSDDSGKSDVEAKSKFSNN